LLFFKKFSFLSLQPNESDVELGKKYITKAIENSFDLGHGIGPLGHFVEIYKRLGIKYW